jgi:chemotaxis protein methyltransferase CheR
LNRVSQDPAYSPLKHELIASTGLAFYEDRDELLTELIDGRLSDLGLRDCSSYAQLLADGQRGSEEMEHLIAQLTIGETYFFRDQEQFAALRDVILPDILKRKQVSKELRIWSAGCANGAEPYSLAILLTRELAEHIAGWQIRIYATDLNRSFLTQAAAGKFRAWALRCTPDEVKRDCFSQEGRTWSIHPRYKQWISFHQLNLVGTQFPTPADAGTLFDLILCRNVMIYFTPEVRNRLVGNFYRLLEHQGWLVVGGSEHDLETYKAFRSLDAFGAKLYQKVLVPLPPMEGAPERPMLPPVGLVSPPSLRATPIEPAREPPKAPPPDTEGLLQFADRGDWQSAAEYGRRLLAQDPLSPASHFYQALVFENLGVPAASERSLRQAIYLDRNFALAHYHLGLALKRALKMPGAERSFRNVLKVLAGVPDDAMLTAGSGVTVTALKELAKMHLENSSAA